MKRKIILSIFAFTLIAMSTITSCKKYEEGPALSLRTKKARLAGSWVVDKVIEDGVDVTSQYNSSNEELIVTFDKGGSVNYSVSGFGITGTWAFSSSKEDLMLTFDFFGSSDTEVYTITRLTNKELWLKEKDDPTDEMHYKAQ